MTRRRRRDADATSWTLYTDRMRFIGVSLLALLAGCGGDDDDAVFVTASWTFRTVAANAPLPCPDGFPRAALNARALDGTCNVAGDTLCVADLSCDAGMGTSTKLVPGVYEVWIEITSSDAATTYATTTSETLDVTLGDKAFGRQILTDGGVFKVGWTLRAGDGSPRTCEQAGVFGIAVSASNEADPSSANSDEIRCVDGIGYSNGYGAGNYTVNLEAVNDSGQTRGVADPLMAKMIVGPNGVTDLGRIDIQLTTP